MTNAITRAQVREALGHSQFVVPDFTTRAKADLAWSKVYISIQDGRLRFVELNLIQRIVRYFVGCYCYSDTVFTDKTTLERVKMYVHGIQVEPTKLIAKALLSKVQTASDCNCLKSMLETCKSDDLEANAEIERLMQQVEALKVKEGSFSEGFLSAAITLAKQNLQKNPEDKLWESIITVFDKTIPSDGAKLNHKRLLFEVLELPQEERFHSQNIKAPKEIEDVLVPGLRKAKESLADIPYIKTLEDCLKALSILEKVDKDLENLLEFLRPFLTQEIGKQMVQDLRKRIGTTVHPSIISAYLADEKQLINRLLYHVKLDNKDLLHGNRKKIEYYRKEVIRKIRDKYRVVDLGPQRDSFSASCHRYQELTGMDSQQIRNPHSPIGLPELTLLSKAACRPVVVVSMEENQWIEGVNLDFDQAPIILNKNKEGIWSPVVTLYDLIINGLRSKIQTSTDRNCYFNMVKKYESDGQKARELMQQVGGKLKVDGFSEGFLSAAIALAKQNLEKDPEDKLWECITSGFEDWRDDNPLLLEVFGLPQMKAFYSKLITVPDEIHYILQPELQKAKKSVDTISTTEETLECHLKRIDSLEKVCKDLDTLPEKLRPFLSQESGKQMVQELRDSLKAHPSIVAAYLDDEKQIVHRLLYHACLALYPRHIREDARVKIESCREAVVEKINSWSYHFTSLHRQTDSFSAICNIYLKSGREKIADELLKDEECRILVKERLKVIKGMTFDDYFKWIRDPQSAIDLPELTMLSKLTGRPILLLCSEKNDKKWSNGINLGFDQKPIILHVDKNGTWSYAN